MRAFLSHALGLAMAIVLILLAIILGACGDHDDPVRPTEIASPLTLASTPDELLDDFCTAYSSRDLSAYAATLHPRYEFVPTDGRTWGRDRELTIAARMFCGEDIQKDGCKVAGITRIEILHFEALGEWQALAAADEVRQSRAYRVGLRFHRTDGTSITVQGRSIFEVIEAREAGVDGEVRTGWQIVRQVDATG